MPCRPTQDWWVMESCDKTCPLEKGMANHFSILALRTPWTVWKGKRYAMKDELPRSVGAQCVTGEEWRNNSRKNEDTEPKQKQCPVVDVTGDGNKVLECYVHESRQIGSGQTGDDKSEHRHFRNQWTKMDWKGQIWFRWPLYLNYNYSLYLNVLWARIP